MNKIDICYAWCNLNVWSKYKKNKLNIEHDEDLGKKHIKKDVFSVVGPLREGGGG